MSPPCHDDRSMERTKERTSCARLAAAVAARGWSAPAYEDVSPSQNHHRFCCVVFAKSRSGTTEEHVFIDDELHSTPQEAKEQSASLAVRALRLEDELSMVPESAANQMPLAKTALCKHFGTEHGCRFGAKCHFAHGSHELRQRPAAALSHYASSSSQSKSSCTNSHVANRLHPVAPDSTDIAYVKADQPARAKLAEMRVTSIGELIAAALDGTSISATQPNHLEEVPNGVVAIWKGDLFMWCRGSIGNVKIDVDGAVAAGLLISGGQRPREWLGVQVMTCATVATGTAACSAQDGGDGASDTDKQSTSTMVGHEWGDIFPFALPGQPTICHMQRCLRCAALSTRHKGSTALLPGEPRGCRVGIAREPPSVRIESLPAVGIEAAVSAELEPVVPLVEHGGRQFEEGNARVRRAALKVIAALQAKVAKLEAELAMVRSRLRSDSVTALMDAEFALSSSP